MLNKSPPHFLTLSRSARLGVHQTKKELRNRYKQEEITVSSNTVNTTTLYRGKRNYELSNHLGNVQVVISDKRKSFCDVELGVERFEAEVLSGVDYYPFGKMLPDRQYYASNDTGLYKYSFNGKLLDRETGFQDYGFRIYYPDLGKFLSVDPLFRAFPWNSLYAFAENDVIRSIDLEGAEKYVVIRAWEGHLYKGTLCLYLPNKGTVRLRRHPDDPKSNQTMILDLDIATQDLNYLRGDIFLRRPNGEIYDLSPRAKSLIYSTENSTIRLRPDVDFVDENVNSSESQALDFAEELFNKGEIGSRILTPLVNKINFDFDEHSSIKQGKDLISVYSTFLNNNSDYVIHVIGHTDKKGSDDYNYSLGLTRANDFRDYLKNNGIDPSRIKVSSRGELDATIDENASDKDRESDRFIEIKWEPKKQ